MKTDRWRVGIIGCGRMGQVYADAYQTYPDTEVVAIADPHAERLRAVGERFGVRELHADAESLLRDSAPDIVAVVTPVKYTRDAVLACAEAGVKGVSADKPIAGVLADGDAMVDACAERGVVFAGGNLQRAMNQVQEAARRLHAGAYGTPVGVSVHGFGGEISGGGCQHISVLRLFTDSEVDEVIAWGTPSEALEQETDEGLIINGWFRLSSGLDCAVYGSPTPQRGVDVWTADSLVRWDWGPPEIFRGFDDQKRRIGLDVAYEPYPWSEFGYLTGSIRSFLAAVGGAGSPWISGHDLRQALEVAIAARHSARLGTVPVQLPLEDRSMALYPRVYRWLGGDASGEPQDLAEAAGR